MNTFRTYVLRWTTLTPISRCTQTWTGKALGTQKSLQERDKKEEEKGEEREWERRVGWWGDIESKLKGRSDKESTVGDGTEYKSIGSSCLVKGIGRRFYGPSLRFT